MNCLRIGKSVLSSLKLHYRKTRSISDIQKKIKNSYYFMHGDAMLSSSRVGQVIDHSADKCGDNTAVISVHQNISKTYSELRQEAEKLASGFISIGLRKGDRIGLYAPNCYEWPLTLFAAAKAGLILVSISTFEPMELEYVLKKVGCKALILWRNYIIDYENLCHIPDLPKSRIGSLKSNKFPNLEHIIWISDDKKDGTLNLNDVLDSANKESDTKLSEIDKSILIDDPLNIAFTSRTTGTPKGAVLTHHNIVNNALLAGRRFGFNLYKPIVCCHLPLFHPFGCVNGVLSTIYYQGTCVLPNVIYHGPSSMSAAEKYRCTVVFGYSYMYIDMVRYQKSEKHDIGALKQAIISGCPTNAHLVKDIKEVLDIPHVMVSYGTIATSPAIATTKLVDDFENVMNGVMQPIEYVEVKIIDSNGQILPVNTAGELCVRGHNTFLGYWEDEEKTAEVLDKTHWYHTGDTATMNEYGFVRVVGRIKDVIIRGGEKIYPFEIENLLSTHPSVREVHVCGVPDEEMGEEVCASICLQEDMQLTEEEVKEFCKNKISHFKIPRYVFFVLIYPKTLPGMIKRGQMARGAIRKVKRRLST